MPKFNYELWKAGQKIEDNLKPKIDKFFECDFKRVPPPVIAATLS